MTDEQACITARVLVAFLLALTCAALTLGQGPQRPAAELVNVVVANELADRVERRKWMYRIEKRDGKQTLTEEQVETKDGPLHRLLAIDGRPLDSDQRKQDDARIDHLVINPSEQLKVKRANDEDEQKLETLMHLMPEAFLYDYEGVEGLWSASNSALTRAIILQLTRGGWYTAWPEQF